MHDGGSTGQTSFVGFTADRTRGVVVLTDIGNNVIDLGLAALNDQSPLKRARGSPTAKFVTLSTSTLDEYVGTYEVHQGGRLRLYRKDDHLFAVSLGNGHDPYSLFPTAKDEFSTNVASRSLSIKRDTEGRVTGVLIHMEGIDRLAPRVPDAEPAERPPTAIWLEASVLDSYVGTYRLSPEWTIEITRESDQLHAQLTGQPAYPVYASANDKFFYTAVDAAISFERDETGRVVALVLHQHGNHRAPRVESH
ncbi:MAG: DUF3471 domain-containing protein [Antricoccus sp.]